MTEGYVKYIYIVLYKISQLDGKTDGVTVITGGNYQVYNVASQNTVSLAISSQVKHLRIMLNGLYIPITFRRAGKIRFP